MYILYVYIYMLNICYVFISPTSIDFFKCKVQATDSTSSQRLWHAITSEMGATGPRPHSGKNVPMDPHGDSAGVWTLCTPVASSSMPQLQKHRHCSAVAVEIPARHFNFKAIKNPRGFFSEMTWLFLGDLLKQFHMVVCHPALERAKAGAGSLLTLLTWPSVYPQRRNRVFQTRPLYTTISLSYVDI